MESLANKYSMRVSGQRWAFSLAEVIVALGVASGAFLVVAALFTQLLRGNQKEADLAAGALIARAVMTERLQKIFAGLEPGLTKEEFFAQNAPPLAPLEGTVTLNRSVFTYRITHQTVSTSGSDPLGGPADRNNRLKKLNVVVWWWADEENATRSGYGDLRVEATRLVNENASFGH